MISPDAPIALYGRVSNKEQAQDRDALTRQLWQLHRAAELFEQDASEYVDVQSGRRDDRPEFQRMLDDIRAKKLSMVVVTRIDRITRDLATNAMLAKLFEDSGCKIYEILLGQTVDWAKPNDWEYFVRSGVRAEAESRVLSARIKQTFDWHREQGKAVGAVGFGYRRNASGFLEPDPEQWATAIAMVRIYLEENGARTRTVERYRQELGLERTMNGLALWIKSPLIRGHTVYGVRSGANKKKPGKPEKIIYNTHSSLLNAPELVALDAARELERIFSERKYKKGTIHSHTIRPLSGLTYCGRCGAVCHVKTTYEQKTTYRYFVCANHSQRQSKCGSQAKGSIYVAYDLVDRAVLEALQERGEDLANLVLSQAAQVEVEDTPEIIALRAQIANLEALADEDLRGAIAKKTTALNRLIAEQSGQDDQSLVEAREMLVQYASVPEFWDIATDAEKKAIYRDFVGGVTVDGADIQVTLLI